MFQSRPILITATVIFWMFGVVGISAWVLYTGGFTELFHHIGRFITNPSIKNDLPGWETTILLSKLLLLNIWTSIIVLFSIAILFKKTFAGELNREIIGTLAKKNFLRFFLALLGPASVEEFIFRWFPLAVLFPAIHNERMLWPFIIGSSAIFALAHIPNHKKLSRCLRRIPLTTTQFIGGLTLSYIFLVYGFASAILFHTFFNFIFLFPVWLYARTMSNTDVFNGHFAK